MYKPEHVLISLADDVQYDALRRAAFRVENQYAVFTRRGQKTQEAARQLLRETELLRDKLDQIDKQAKKSLEDCKCSTQ